MPLSEWGFEIWCEKNVTTRSNENCLVFNGGLSGEQGDLAGEILRKKWLEIGRLIRCMIVVSFVGLASLQFFNIQFLYVFKLLERRKKTFSRAQRSLLIADMITCFLAVLTLVERQWLHVSESNAACVHFWVRLAAFAPIVGFEIMLLTSEVLLLLACMDRVQALYRPLVYRLVDKAARARRMNLISYSLGFALVLATCWEPQIDIYQPLDPRTIVIHQQRQEIGGHKMNRTSLWSRARLCRYQPSLLISITGYFGLAVCLTLFALTIALVKLLRKSRLSSFRNGQWSLETGTALSRSTIYTTTTTILGRSTLNGSISVSAASGLRTSTSPCADNDANGTGIILTEAILHVLLMSIWALITLLDQPYAQYFELVLVILVAAQLAATTSLLPIMSRNFRNVSINLRMYSCLPADPFRRFILLYILAFGCFTVASLIAVFIVEFIVAM